MVYVNNFETTNKYFLKTYNLIYNDMFYFYVSENNIIFFINKKYIKFYN